MPGNDTLPHQVRASDEDRDKAIDVLRQGMVRGQLSDDTFIYRMDAALQARHHNELAALLRDLPQPPPREDWLTRSARSLHWRLRQAWSSIWPAELRLPRGSRVFVIGRSPACDLTVPNMTVSWQHAQLRPSPWGWILVDLGSTNGTHVNGWRAGCGIGVRPGDSVWFGTASFRIVE